MFLKFGVSNFRSIKDYQEISFVSSGSDDTPSNNNELDKYGVEVLPMTCIYGANASGKSNFLRSILFFKDFIKFSHLRMKKTSVTPFLLNSKYKKLPTKMQCNIVVDNVLYQYGFIINSERVLEEWLYSFPQQRKRELFYRKFKNKKDEFSFGRHLVGSNSAISKLTKSNSLFLTVAAQNNHEELGNLYNYFVQNIEIYDRDVVFKTNEFIKLLKSKSPESDYLLNFVKMADIGISDVKLEQDDIVHKAKVDSDSVGVAKDFLSQALELTAQLRSELLLEGHEVPSVDLPEEKLIFVHSSSENSHSAVFDLYNESEGTKALIEILPIILSTISKGALLVIDEVDTSLHPLLVKKLLSIFKNKDLNSSGAQVLFTTHDTNLLSRDILRRDEVWFTEKCLDGATELYPLSDIKIRPTDNMRKGYLEGRFGGIPFLGDLDTLVSGTGE